MEVYIETNSLDKTNFISFNQFKIRDIPILAIKNYFCNSKENLYFFLMREIYF